MRSAPTMLAASSATVWRTQTSQGILMIRQRDVSIRA